MPVTSQNHGRAMWAPGITAPSHCSDHIKNVIPGELEMVLRMESEERDAVPGTG